MIKIRMEIKIKIRQAAPACWETIVYREEAAGVGTGTRFLK